MKNFNVFETIRSTFKIKNKFYRSSHKNTFQAGLNFMESIGFNVSGSYWFSTQITRKTELISLVIFFN